MLILDIISVSIEKVIYITGSYVCAMWVCKRIIDLSFWLAFKKKYE